MKDVPNSATLAHVFQMTLYRVRTNHDLTEGRGGEYTLGWFIDNAVAIKAAKGNYVMGSDCPVETRRELVVRTEDGKVFLLGERVEVKYEDPREVRARALSKLSPEEREVLGIKG